MLQQSSMTQCQVVRVYHGESQSPEAVCTYVPGWCGTRGAGWRSGDKDDMQEGGGGAKQAVEVDATGWRARAAPRSSLLHDGR